MIGTLYAEELKATLRGRFAWIGAAILLLALGALATVSTQGAWLQGYGLIAYGLGSMAFIPIAAVTIASPRVNRFVECVFTAPVRRRDWLVAKFLVLLTLAATYYVALLPMMLVYVLHVGFPPLLVKLLLWAPGLLVASVCIGTLIGVLFVGESMAAPAGAAMGVLMAYAGLLPLQELMVAQGIGDSHTGHVTLISPAVLLKNALGFAVAASSVPASTLATWISLAVVVGGALALAAWVFLKAQGVETWEATRPQKWTIGLLLVVLVCFPALVANTNYDAAAPRATRAPAVRGPFPRAGMPAVLVAPGAGMPRRCCSALLNRNDWPLGTGRTTPRDLLLLLPVTADQQVTRLTTSLAGAGGLAITAAGADLDQSPPHLERTDVGYEGSALDGRRAGSSWLARIPVQVTPSQPWDIGGDRYEVTISARYDVAGDPQPRSFTVHGLVEAQVPDAIYQTGLAALIVPLFCLGAAIRRSWRTR